MTATGTASDRPDLRPLLLHHRPHHGCDSYDDPAIWTANDVVDHRLLLRHRRPRDCPDLKHRRKENLRVS